MRLIDAMINKHLHEYERDNPRWDRIKRWHRNRVMHDCGPVFWTLSHIWWMPRFQWLWRLRCRNVAYRMERHHRRLTRNGPNSYDWSGAQR